MTFGDRFTILDDSFKSITANLEFTTNEQLALSKELKMMADMVRRHSILLKSVELKEVYEIITEHSDPEIALILASAKNPDGLYRFPTEDVIKQFMFGDTASIRPQLINPINNIFREGIRRVSAAFAASLLVLKYGIVDKQLDIATSIYAIGEKELDRIIHLPDKLTSPNAAAQENDTATLYFEPYSFTTTSLLSVYFFLPNSINASSWKLVNSYPIGTVVNTKLLTIAITDAINRYTLNQANNTNIIGALSLNGLQGLYTIGFGLRYITNGVESELISIKFEYGLSKTDTVPFKWGWLASLLGYEPINSSLLIVKNPKDSKLVSAKVDPSAFRQVLYFKNSELSAPATVQTAPIIPAALLDNTLTYRLSVTEDIIHSVSIPNDTPLLNRHDVLALTLINDLHKYKDESRLLGAIIRNDPLTENTPLTAVELVSWSVTNPETRLVLDILSVPDNIEIALGDVVQPITQFSSLPMSLVIESAYKRAFPFGTSGAGGSNQQPYIIKMKPSKLLDDLKQIDLLINGGGKY